MSIKISEAKVLTDELMAALRRLIPQLSTSASVPTEDDVKLMLTSDSTHLLVAEDDDHIVGLMALVVFRIPTGVRGWIEDVVVDSEARGRGVGEALNRHALNLAQKLGARTVDLTSRPSREAANRLYQKIGFVERETNVYRWSS